MLPMLAATLLLAACSSSATSAPAASSGGGAASAPAASAGGDTGAACAAAPAGATAAETVTIKDFKFSPEPVQAKVGDVIAWTNSDTASHSATLDNGACDTKPIDVGATAMLVFTAPGTYTYHCSVHPTQMKGFTIQVQ
jgi:plastocyanin